MRGSADLERLVQRRERLREQVREQRGRLGVQVTGLQAALSPVELAWRLWRSARRHPAVVLAGLAAPLLASRRGVARAVRWGAAAIALWQVAREFRRNYSSTDSR